MLLVLRRSPEQEAALARLIEDQHNTQSPDYHHWLTPQQFGDRFGPSQADIDSITQWLSSNGFQVAQVSKGRAFVEFSGSAQTVKRAFGTPIHRYVVDGQQYWANTSDPTIPSALAPVVVGIDSLHNFQKQAQNVPLKKYTVGRSNLVSPEYTFGGSTDQASDYAIAPYDFAAIYDLFPLWNATPTPINGAGQTVAIVGRSDINPADAITLWNYFGLDGTHAPQPKLVVTYNGPNPGTTADEAEADIDTQWSGAVAPGATIDYVVSASTATTDGIDLSALYIVDNNLAPVLSVSYGACEAGMGTAGVQFYGSLWQQAAAQGISVLVSSGDSGAAGCDDPAAPASGGLQVNGIASTPFNTAVGGTDFNQYQAWATYWNATNDPVTRQSAKGYIPETTWNDSCTNAILQTFSGGSANPESNCNNSNFRSLLDSTGGGGGQSSTWLKPTWQTGTPNDNARDLPDVSLFASNGFLNSYYLVCQSDIYGGACQFGSFQGFGGTSVSAPQFAGVMALINQKTGSPQGIPGLTLYKLAAQQPSAFHDIADGSTIAMPCATGTPNCVTNTSGDAYGILSGYNAVSGYDLATGLGSVDITNLVNQWQSISFTPSSTTLTVNGGNDVNIIHGAPIPFSINVTPSAATGEAALLVAPGTPGNPGIAAFPLISGAVADSTSLLPGGSYNLLAHYSGDATYGGSYSNSVAVTVSPEPSTTFVNLITTSVTGTPIAYSASSATYGSGYLYLRVDIGDAHASLSPSTGISSQCSGRKESCPTGTVLLSAPGTSLDGISLSLNDEGFAQIPAPPPGTYTVTATYRGDSSFGASAGSTSFTIAKASTTAAAAVSGLPVEYGNQEQLDAGITTTSNGVAPTGTFQFYVDGNPLSGPQGINESFGYGGFVNGTYAYADAGATLVTNFLTTGNHTISAQYSGDANYAASTSAASTFTVTQATPIFESVGIESTGGGPAVAGQNATATATIFGSSAGAAPTGTVTFYANGVAIPGTVTYVDVNSSPTLATLTASLSTVFPTPGSVSISASYSGDANYSAATYAPASFTILGPISVTGGAGIVISSPGSGGSTSLSIIPNGPFSGTATVSCTPDPKANETGCSLTSGTNSGSTLQVNVSGAGTSMTFNVTTTASHQVAHRDTPRRGAPSGIALVGLLALFFPAVRRRSAAALCLLGLSLTIGLAACGGSGGSGGGGGGGGGGGNIDAATAPGQYNFTVTATTGSGADQFTTTAQVPVVVN